LDEPFLYIYGVLAVDRDVFEKLSPDDQHSLREVMGGVFKDLDRLNRKDNVNAMEVLRKQGIEFIKPDAQALKKWYSDAGAIPERLIQAGRLSREIVDALESLLKDYRSKHPGANE